MNTDLEKLLEERAKPKPPLETQIQREAATRAEWQGHLLSRNVWQSCLNCDHWVNTNVRMGCALHEAMPPIKVVVVGCKDHLADIPF